MGADREGRGRRRPARVMAYATGGVLVLAGCASMPDSGDLRGVESTPRQETQVRVFAVPPGEDAPPSEIVQGFLEALTSDDPHYKTARQYLTGEAAKTWRPEASATVLTDGPGAKPEAGGGGEDTGEISYMLTGTKVATVDAQQAYAPATGAYGRSVHLTQDAKRQWRIDALPQGVVMGESDFQRNYMSVSKYYFASNTAAAGAKAQPGAVADPVYVRRRVEPMTQMVNSLLKGPTRWLGPVVRSSFPTGTALAKDADALTPDERNRLTVPLNDKAAGIGANRCREMAAQILFTLRNLSPAVDEVALRAGGAELCSLTQAGADTAATRSSARHPDYLYFVDGKHRLVRIPAGSSGTKPDPAPGALGDGETALRSVAVSRDEHTAAGVGLDGKSLYVGSLVSGGSLGDPVLRSQGPAEKDRLTTPSWDADDNLWVADRDPDDPRLLLFQEGKGEPVQVRMPHLDGRIQSVRVAADGVRIALVVEKGGKKTLLVGLIERDEKPGAEPTVSVVELRSATPELEEVTTMSWAGDSRLVVVGREHGGVEQMRYVQVDGSTPDVPAPAALTGVKEVTAAEDDQLPLVAYSVDGIVRLPSGEQWQKVTEGTAPVYPG
ncbi:MULTISPECIES: LpqB family beta-propeller domain-containing protein [Streptomyces]|uniref:Lipoprotein LpqB n=1 Tax=Streptomyces indiaensis TaxID=284033 RepID=A0ABN3DIP6_9ACTN|nr:LpqB family beta-propeller domain-containing protein [Streptomyces indiaensis]MCF1649809.1 LpqB family beta-propeller domain-containing protein [Streptomyces indiaensis]